VNRAIPDSAAHRNGDGAAARTIQGIETMNMIRKGQIRWLAKGDIIGQAFVANLFGITSVA